MTGDFATARQTRALVVIHWAGDQTAQALPGKPDPAARPTVRRHLRFLRFGSARAGQRHASLCSSTTPTPRGRSAVPVPGCRPSDISPRNVPAHGLTGGCRAVSLAS
jgi:hypothetical protein